jgi:hypothetical protein
MTNSAAMQALAGSLHQAIRTSGAILLSGEPGTGREHLARAIHLASDGDYDGSVERLLRVSMNGGHNGRPFVIVDCADGEGLERRLFWVAANVADASTGGLDRIGEGSAIDRATNGTLFLRQVADHPDRLHTIPTVQTSRHHARRRGSPRASVSRLELVIVAVGLVAAVASGIIAYRIVGPYGDGPFGAGYRRVIDSETGRSVLIHESRAADGTVIRRVIDNRTLREIQFELDVDGRREEVRVPVERGSTQVTRVDRDRDADGRVDVAEYYDADQRLVKAGFSLAGDGAIDAWAYRDEAGQLVTIEVSTRRDGRIDRWEYYENNQLARVEQDTDRDGRVDAWSTYDAGILIDTVFDRDGDGEPDPR